MRNISKINSVLAFCIIMVTGAAHAGNLNPEQDRSVYEAAGYKQLTEQELKNLHEKKTLTFLYKGKKVPNYFDPNGTRITSYGGKKFKTKWGFREGKLCWDSVRGVGNLCYDVLTNNNGYYIYCDLDEAPICTAAVIKVE